MDGDLQKLANDMGSFFTSVSCSMDKLKSEIIPASESILMNSLSVLIKGKSVFYQFIKAIGPDTIPNWILKDCALILSGPMSIFNSSVRESYIRTIWKSATVIPIPKVACASDITKDFRPISLTPTLSKILDRFVPNWIMDMVSDNLDVFQFGAIKHSSPAYALIKIIHEWAQHTDD